MEFILRHCTEVGIRAFQPVVTRHGLRPSTWNALRWKKIIVEVCKQCERAYFPTIFEPISLQEYLEKTGRLRILCSETNRKAKLTDLDEQKSLDILIGPEGGWHSDELAAITSDAKPLGLGPHRLRVETAAVVASAIVLLR
jgi:16S rRNA (uracil1498-N3)-methyltransferase